MFTSLDAAGLLDCLSQIPPLVLQAVVLLQEQRRTTNGSWFPTVPPGCVAEAAQELIAYTRSCVALTDRLQYLPPVMIPDLEIPTWPL